MTKRSHVNGGTARVRDDERLVLLHVHSPGTVANSAADRAVEVNVVDPIRRRGRRIAERWHHHLAT